MISPRPNLGARPDPHQEALDRLAAARFEIAVPVAGSIAERTLDPGSGLVLLPFDADPSKALAYYEGNRYGAQNLRTWPERVHMAFSRAATRYPTIARSLFDRSELEVVGEFCGNGNRLTLMKPDAVARWLGVDSAVVHREALAWDKEQSDKQMAKDFRSGRGFGRTGRF